MEFKEGTRVKHISHGKGTIVDVDRLDLDSITVEFDVEPEGWGSPLRVSKSCSKIIMNCTACGNECFEDEIYPQAVFWDDKKCICEECSIDFEEFDGVVQFRQDLIEDGYIEPVFEQITLKTIGKISAILEMEHLTDKEKVRRVSKVIVEINKLLEL